MRQIVGILAIISLLIISGSASATFVGQQVSLGNNLELSHELDLTSGDNYIVSLKVRSDLSGAQVRLTINFYDNHGFLVDYITVERGLGSEGSWNLIGIEFQMPDNIARSELLLTSEQVGAFFWDELVVQRLNQTTDEVRTYWEERFEIYGPIYTGLVIDARDVNARRGISPRVYSESGQLIYGGVLASPDFVQETGVVAYSPELTSQTLQRIQVDPDYGYALPLIIEATGVMEPARTSVYVSDEDTQRILEALAYYDFLARYAVIFLVD